MAKSRHGPALFELLGDEGGTATVPRVPRWWSSGRTREARAATDAPPATVRVESGSVGAERLIAVDGDRIRVSLTSVTAAGAIFVVLALATAAYTIGSRSGDRAGFRRGYEAARAAVVEPAADEITAIRNQPPATHLLAPASGKAKPDAATVRPPQPEAPGPSSTVAGKTGWVKDLTYIVVQEFPTGSMERAKAAQQFLAQRGVETEAVSAASGGVHLITTLGYNHKDPAQKKLAEQLLAKVRTIGGQYYAAGGGYKLEGYYKTLKRDSW